MCPATPKHLCGFPENKFLCNHRVPVAAKKLMSRRCLVQPTNPSQVLAIVSNAYFVGQTATATATVTTGFLPGPSRGALCSLPPRASAPQSYAVLHDLAFSWKSSQFLGGFLQNGLNLGLS